MELDTQHPLDPPSHHVNDDNENEIPCEAFASDSSEIFKNTVIDTRTCEISSPLPSSIIDTNSSICHIPNQVPNSEEDSEIIHGIDDDTSHASSTFAEACNATNSDEDAYHSLTELNSPSPNPSVDNQLIPGSDFNSTEVNKITQPNGRISFHSLTNGVSKTSVEVKTICDEDESSRVNIAPTTNEDESPINNIVPTTNEDESSINNIVPTTNEDASSINNIVPTTNEDESSINNIVPTTNGDESSINNIVPTTNGDESSIHNIAPTTNEDESSINNIAPTTNEDDGDVKEIREIKKFFTSSYDLEAIIESLYTLPKPTTPKVDQESCDFQTTVFILSQASFCNYPEGSYTVKLFQRTLSVIEESKNLMSIPVDCADLSVIDESCLKLDNKLGRCLIFKCDTQEELKVLEEEMQLHCLKSWESENFNLVHYPLKFSQNIVIIDLGSCSTRAGILMDQATLPFLFFPSVCATNKTTGTQVYGKEALNSNARKNSNVSFPLRPSIKIIKHAIDIDVVKGLFKKIFHELNVDPIHYKVQVCLPRSLSVNSQHALLKLLLEDLKVMSVCLTHQALLTLYAHNVSTGLVVDVGDRMDILPVVDGFIVENGVTRLPYGGQRLIHHMKYALAEKHVGLSNDIDSFVVQYISESLAYVAQDYDDEIASTAQCPEMVKKSIAVKTFAEDENCFQYATLDTARFKIPEGLFKPELWGLDNQGIHKLVQKAIQATSVDVRKIIAQNIYISGGVTMMPGFVERLKKEVTNLNKPRITPKVIASNYRYHCTYIGACEFARMEVFPKVCVGSEEYAKNPSSALKKFALCY